MDFNVPRELFSPILAGHFDCCVYVYTFLLWNKQIDYDRSGRSKEVAMVVFRRREDAELAVSQFHKRTLDGAPMSVEILEGPQPSRGGMGSGMGGRTDGIRGRGAVSSAAGRGGSWRGERAGTGSVRLESERITEEGMAVCFVDPMKSSMGSWAAKVKFTSHASVVDGVELAK